MKMLLKRTAAEKHSSFFLRVFRRERFFFLSRRLMANGSVAHEYSTRVRGHAYSITMIAAWRQRTNIVTWSCFSVYFFFQTTRKFILLCLNTRIQKKFCSFSKYTYWQKLSGGLWSDVFGRQRTLTIYQRWAQSHTHEVLYFGGLVSNDISPLRGVVNKAKSSSWYHFSLRKWVRHSKFVLVSTST